MISLLVLSAVLLAFSVLGGSEPLIASNHLMAVQARAIAEAGLERALWALNNPGTPGGVPWSAVAPPPYDGSLLFPVATETATIGGFHLAISGESGHQRQVWALGQVPGSPGPLGGARQPINVTVVRLRFPDPPAGFTVRGDLVIGDGAEVDAGGDDSCGEKAGTWSAGTTTLGAGSQVRGHAGDPAPNGLDDIRQQEPIALFDERAYTAGDWSALRALARSRGTYYRGAMVFDAAHPMPDGLVFIDTASGQPIGDTTPDTDLATVSIGDGAFPDPARPFRGWIIVNGSLSISGSVHLQGFAYAADRLIQSGSSRLVGAAMAGHVRSAAPSRVDARPAGSPAVTWSCREARTGGGLIPQNWMIKPGSYRETGG